MASSAFLLAEVECLLATTPAGLENILLTVLEVLGDFDDYPDMLVMLEQALADAWLEGVLQIAHFYPDYRFGRFLALGQSRLGAGVLPAPRGQYRSRGHHR